MKALIDLNVVMDVVQRRQPHYAASARVLTEVRRGRVGAVLPGHALTTIFYLVERHVSREQAEAVVDWMLASFDVASASKRDFLQARTLSVADFEDAVVASLAAREGCDYIVTRNVQDFSGTSPPAITPADFLARLS